MSAGLALSRALWPNPDRPPPVLPAPRPIRTRQELQDHLRTAIRLELTTIPAYLYAYWSVKDRRSDPARVLLSVSLEEMLHLTYACNLLLAAGARVRLYDPAVAPTYPSDLPNHVPPLKAHLYPLGPDALMVFLAIELPESLAVQRAVAAGAGAAPTNHASDEYATIGQFYDAIEECFVALDASDPTFWADTQAPLQFFWFRFHSPGSTPETRIDEDSFNVVGTASDPELGPVENLRHARNAIRSIIRQGEGGEGDPDADDDGRELAHYYKFLAVQRWWNRGRDGDDDRFGPPDVYPCRVDPRTRDLPAGRLCALADLGNAAFAYLLLSLDHVYALRHGEDPRDAIVTRNVRELMVEVLTPVGRRLASAPIPGSGTAGLSFEFWDFAAMAGARGLPVDPREQVIELFGRLDEADRDELEGCGSSIRRLVAVALPAA